MNPRTQEQSFPSTLMNSKENVFLGSIISTLRTQRDDALQARTNASIALVEQTALREQAELDLAAANNVIATVTDERDQARMMYCELDNSVYTKEEIAAQQGWDYLYPIPEGGGHP